MNSAIGAVEARKQSEMEMLGSRLADILLHLRETNDRSMAMITQFLNEPSPPVLAAPPSVIGPAEPIPGTLSSLSMLTDRLDQEAGRAAILVGRLRQIIGN